MTDHARPPARPRAAPPAEDPAVPKNAAPVAAQTPPSPLPAPARRRRGPAATIQLNTRVDPEVDALVAYVCDVRGWSKREAVEFALAKTYARELREIELARERESKRTSE